MKKQTKSASKPAVRAAAPKKKAGRAAPAPEKRPAVPAARTAAESAAARRPAPAAPPKLKLDKAQKKKYTELLLRFRDKIQKQISYLSSDSLSKQDADEPRDDVTDDFDRDFALNLLTSEHDIMFEIAQAMKRIEDGTYGRCDQCGGRITSARLEAVPFAKMCIVCQSSMEQGRPRYQPFGSTIADAGKAAGSQSASPEE